MTSKKEKSDSILGESR